MNISLLEPLGIPAEEIGRYAHELEEMGHTFTYYDQKTTDPEELKARSRGQDVVMIANNPYPDEVVREADSLKMLAVAFTGIDHVGLDACREKGVQVCNCAGYSNVSVAEQVIGMTIHMLRFFGAGDSAVRSHGTSAGLTGSEICGKKVGIIGCGQIGFMTAKLFQAFGASVSLVPVMNGRKSKQPGSSTSLWMNCFQSAISSACIPPIMHRPVA